MTDYKVWVFFYGSFINLDVLKAVEVYPENVEVGRSTGYDIVIQPLANLIRSDGTHVYGILAQVTHDELGRLYIYAQDALGGVYLPEAVLVDRDAASPRPALCYIAHDMEPAPATADYVERIVKPARQLGFPDSYIRKLESFVV